MSRWLSFSIVLGLFLCITTSPVSRWLEATMVRHVLVQLPLLVLLGVWIAGQLPHYIVRSISVINLGGIFGCICISYIFLFWMIPRWLDASLTETWVAWSKYLSLLCGGVLFRLSWPKAHFITRGFLQIEFLAMLFRLGWLYLISPERLCNNYLINDQAWLGRSFLVIGLALSITWLVPIFFGSWAESRSVNRDKERKNKTQPVPIRDQASCS